MKFSNVFLHLMIAGCGEHMFVSSKMEKKTNLRSVHAHKKKSVAGISTGHLLARATQEADDDGVKPVGAPGASADDGSVDDATESVDDGVSADDGVVRPLGAASADDTSADDAVASADDESVDDATESVDDGVSADDGVVRPEGAPSADDTSADDAVASADDGSADDATESVDDSVPNSVVVAQGITDLVNSIIDNNYGTPPPTPEPTADDKDNAIDDVVSSISDAIGNIMNP